MFSTKIGIQESLLAVIVATALYRFAVIYNQFDRINFDSARATQLPVI